MKWDLGRMTKYREYMREHEALKEIAMIIARYLPNDFELTKEEAMGEIVEILEKTDIFEEVRVHARKSANR